MSATVDVLCTNTNQGHLNAISLLALMMMSLTCFYGIYGMWNIQIPKRF